MPVGLAGVKWMIKLKRGVSLAFLVLEDFPYKRPEDQEESSRRS